MVLRSNKNSEFYLNLRLSLNQVDVLIDQEHGVTSFEDGLFPLFGHMNIQIKTQENL
jgi:hypothetical protein